MEALQSAHTVYLCSSKYSHNKQRLFPKGALSNWDAVCFLLGSTRIPDRYEPDHVLNALQVSDFTEMGSVVLNLDKTSVLCIHFIHPAQKGERCALIFTLSAVGSFHREPVCSFRGWKHPSSAKELTGATFGRRASPLLETYLIVSIRYMTL